MEISKSSFSSSIVGRVVHIRTSLIRSLMVIFCASVLLHVAGCGPGGKDDSPSVEAIEEPVDDDEKLVNDSLGNLERVAFLDRVRPSVERFCGDCHAMPRPSSSTKEMWVEEVNQGFALYGESGRTDLEVPYDDVLKYFQFQHPGLKLPDN